MNAPAALGVGFQTINGEFRIRTRGSRGRLKPYGSEIGQQASGKGFDVGHGVFRRAILTP